MLQGRNTDRSDHVLHSLVFLGSLDGYAESLYCWGCMFCSVLFCYFQRKHNFLMSSVPLNPVSAGIATDDNRETSILRTFHCKIRLQKMLKQRTS